MTKREIINSVIYILFVILIFSCNKKKENIFLTNENGDIIEILKTENKISIFEYDNSRKMLLRNLVKINGEYFDENKSISKKKDSDSFLFLSIKNEKSYVVVDKRSLLNDSVIIGKKENNLFYSEIKSNNKPVNFKYYYDENYKIKKIKIKIGKEIHIYK